MRACIEKCSLPTGSHLASSLSLQQSLRLSSVLLVIKAQSGWWASMHTTETFYLLVYLFVVSGAELSVALARKT